MRAFFTSAIVCAAVMVAAAQSGEKTYGKGVVLQDAVKIADLYASPEKFMGKAVRVDGVVTEVCAEMGCWMALASPDNKNQIVTFKAEHDGQIVFPMSARGKSASAEGTFQAVAASDNEAKEAAAERKDPQARAFSMKYQIKATGAVIR